MDPYNSTLLIIIGVHKAATTSMFRYLSAHKEICIGTKKEIHYYTPIRFGKSIDSLESYLKQFTNCKNENIYLDASPSYLYGKSAIANKIKNDFKNVKVLVLLRDPTDRFISFYKNLKSSFRLDQKEKFITFLKKSYSLKSEPDRNDAYYRAFREGCYADYLEDWFNIFGDSIKIVFFEDIKNEPNKIMKAICAWLSINDNIYYDDTLFQIKNKTRMSKIKFIYKIATFMNRNFESFYRINPLFKTYLNKIYYKLNEDTSNDTINKNDIEVLRSYYKSKNENLFKLLKKQNFTEFPNWLRGD